MSSGMQSILHTGIGADQIEIEGGREKMDDGGIDDLAARLA